MAKAGIVAELRRVVFRRFPERIPAAKLLREVEVNDIRIESESDIEVRLQNATESAKKAKRIVMVVRNPPHIPIAPSL